MTSQTMWVGELFAVVAADPATAGALNFLAANAYAAAPCNLFTPTALSTGS